MGLGAQRVSGRRGNKDGACCRSCKAGLCFLSAATVRMALCAAPRVEPREACCHSMLSSAVPRLTAVSTAPPGRALHRRSCPDFSFMGAGRELGCCLLCVLIQPRGRIASYCLHGDFQD